MSSQQRDELAGRLTPIVAESVGALGLDLDCLDVSSAGRRRQVKVVVDAEDGVDLDLLAQASRTVSATLDQHDELLAGPYTLEVTSPGIDRPLTQPRHWRRARLRLVRFHRHDGGQFTGRVGAADEHGVRVLVDGALRRVQYRDIAKAVVEIEFRSPSVHDLRLLEPTGDEVTKEES
ncbi:MAG TPA: ribosome maturation factor RimP [Pseudonocardiaceae bacterium]|nr:ribosome maturation factor RimP [Pseudonocardiaceae bacterium]